MRPVDRLRVNTTGHIPKKFNQHKKGRLALKKLGIQNKCDADRWHQAEDNIEFLLETNEPFRNLPIARDFNCETNDFQHIFKMFCDRRNIAQNNFILTSEFQLQHS